MNLQKVIGGLDHIQQNAIISMLKSIQQDQPMEKSDIGLLGYSISRMRKEDILRIFHGDKGLIQLANNALGYAGVNTDGTYNLTTVVRIVIAEDRRISEEKTAPKAKTLLDLIEQE